MKILLFFDYRNPIDPVPIKMDKAYVDGRYIYTFKERLEYSNIMIAYICGENKTCNTFDENTDLGNIQIIFPEYTINHTNNPPVDEHSSISYFSKIFPFSESIRFQDIKFEWENIKYNDQKSLFDTLTRKKTEYIFGYIKNIENKIEKFGINNISINRYIKGYGYCLFLINMRFFNEHKTYLYNKRTLISFIDVLAKLFSLLMTINSVFKVVYSFYSKNYDNYEIIEKILNPPKELIVKKEDTTELKDITSIKPEGEKKTDIIYDASKNELLIKDSSFISIKKFCCWDFVINNIYSKCCPSKINQTLINNANDMIYKYLSVENLVLNQIKFEKLLKDYKWNNKELNNINQKK